MKKWGELVSINRWHTKLVEAMGTHIDIGVSHPDGRKLLNWAEHKIKELDQRFSANRPDSELSVVNQLAGVAPVLVHEDLFQLVTIGKEMSLEPASLFNIAIGPLVQLWRIGFSDAKKPSPAEIDQALTLIDPVNIQLNNETQSIYLAKAGMQVDLGALVKGYTADLIVDYFIGQDASAALINLGGNIRTYGSPPRGGVNKEWRIGIQHPGYQRGHNIAAVEIYNRSVVTTGDYERVLTDNGRRYHHILNPKTGYPIKSDWQSVTVITTSSLEGEKWSSRLFTLSYHEAIELVESVSEVEAVMIDQSNQMYVSGGLDGKVERFV